jgi:hypothetical protein
MSVPNIVPLGHEDSVDCPCGPVVTRECVECGGTGKDPADGSECWLCDDGCGRRPASAYDYSVARTGGSVAGLMIVHGELPALEKVDQADGGAE